MIRERRVVKNDDERYIITGMIVNDGFLERVLKVYKPEYFELPYSRYISRWCEEYYEKYNKAPKDDLKLLFESKRNTIYDESLVESIDIFLDKLNDDFTNNDMYLSDFVFDKAKVFFKWRSFDLLSDKIKAAKLSDDPLKAESAIADFERVEESNISGINVLSNIEIIPRVLESADDKNALLRFPGALGKLIRPFKRQDFIAFFGPAKRGKSWFLLEMAVLGLMNRLNVLFISLEMPEDQILTRFYQRITGCVTQGDSRDVEVPFFKDGENIVGKKVKKVKEINTNDIIKKLDAINSLSKGSVFKLYCVPSGSIKASEIRDILKNFFYYEGFVPGLILLDFADICAPEKKNAMGRDKIDDTWRICREISQEFDCCFGTVSHTNKATFGRDIKQSDASEDIRKINHLTWGASINQNDDDEKNNAIRIKIMADRLKKFNKKREVSVLQCLDIGQPYIDSRFIKK